MSEPLMIRGRPPRAVALAMLEAQGLPVEDLTEAGLDHFFYLGSDGAPRALVGVEILGKEGLLRSLVVAERDRNRGLGTALVRHAEAYAVSLGVRTLYLLTLTAAAFFKRLGYEPIARALAPAVIQGTREFARLCPASSALLKKCLLSE